MIKKIFSIFISLLIAFVIAIGGWAAGFYLTKLNLPPVLTNFATPLYLILLAITISLAIFNCVKGSAFAKKINNMSATERESFSLSFKNKIENDYAEAEKRVNKAINAFNLYKIAVLLLFFALSFSIGFSLLYHQSFVLILIIFFAFGVAYSFIAVQKNTPDKKLFIDKKQFEKIFSIINRASEQVGFNGKINVIAVNGGISIAIKSEKEVIIALQSEIVALLTEEELYSVMLHEFAHYKNQDTHSRFKFTSFIESNDFDSTNIPLLASGKALFLNGLLQPILLNVATFEVISSRNKEQIADQFVKTQNCEQAFINATAKVQLFAIYGEHSWKEITFDVYENEQPITDYCQRNLACFYKKVGQYGDKWHFTLKNELPARIDSHPTLAMRMNALGVSEYQTDFNRPNGDYFNEQEKLLEKGSQLSVEFGFPKNGKTDVYKAVRQTAYFERKAVMKKYDEADSEWGNLSVSELIECAQAFLYIDDQKAEKILREVIEKSNSSFACYLLGCLYAREYNDECIELFKRASVDSTATIEAYSQLGKYALKTGNQPLLDEYRAIVAKKSQNAEENLQQTLFTKDGLTCANQTDEVVQELKRTICEYWGDTLNALYVACRETENQTTVYYVAVDYDKKAPSEKTQTAYEESCYFINRLSCSNKKYYLFFVGKEYNEIKSLKDSCVYRKQK